jgi:hypothetical protein
MTDYVITEQALHDANQRLNSRGWENIEARPLSEELKKERERINNELDYIEHVSNIHEYDVTVYLKDVRKVLRSEQP